MQRKNQKLCQYEVNDRGGNGEQSAVEAVEQSSMTGKDVAAVFDAKLAFDEALYKIAPGAEDYNGKGKT